MRKVTFITPLEKQSPMEITSGKVFMPRYGPVAIASQLSVKGYDAIVFDENVSDIIDWKRVFSSDAVCFSLMSFCAAKGFEYIRRVRENSAAAIIIGGLHASIMPDECLKHADWVVRGEGDETVNLLLERIFSGGDARDLEGISYSGADGAPVHNAARAFMPSLDFKLMPGLVSGYGPVSLSRMVKDALRNLSPRFNILPVQAGRGCPYNCSFCFVKDELGNTHRLRDIEDVLGDIDRGLRHLRTRNIFFVDNDLTLNREYVRELFKRLAAKYSGRLVMYFFSRVSFAHDTETIEIMKTAGKICVAVGVESINDSTLRQFSKEQSRAQVVEALELFRKSGVDIQALTIFGGEEDTVETIHETIDFYIENEVFNVGICCLYDFPERFQPSSNPPMWHERRFIHKDWRFFNGNFVVFYPMLMKPSTLQKEIYSAFRRFYSKQKKTVYQYHPSLATAKSYIPFLESVEKGLYDKDERLREDKLPPKPLEGPLDIRVRASERVFEAFRFYSGNLCRPVSWRMLRDISN